MMCGRGRKDNTATLWHYLNFRLTVWQQQRPGCFVFLPLITALPLLRSFNSHPALTLEQIKCKGSKFSSTESNMKENDPRVDGIEKYIPSASNVLLMCERHKFRVVLAVLALWLVKSAMEVSVIHQEATKAAAAASGRGWIPWFWTQPRKTTEIFGFCIPEISQNVLLQVLVFGHLKLLWRLLQYAVDSFRANMTVSLYSIFFYTVMQSQKKPNRSDQKKESLLKRIVQSQKLLVHRMNALDRRLDGLDAQLNLFHDDVYERISRCMAKDWHDLKTISERLAKGECRIRLLEEESKHVRELVLSILEGSSEERSSDEERSVSGDGDEASEES